MPARFADHLLRNYFYEQYRLGRCLIYSRKERAATEDPPTPGGDPLISYVCVLVYVLVNKSCQTLSGSHGL